MNVYGGRSTVPDDVKKWSNECDARNAAPDRDAVRCTLAVVSMKLSRLHLMPMSSDALAVVLMKLSELHLMPMPSNALTVVLMSGLLHPTVKRSDALTIVWLPKLHLMSMSSDALTVVWLSDCCIRSWNDQMHAGGCLLTRIRWCWLCVENIMSERLHLIPNDQMHWRNCFLMSEKLHPTPNDRMHWRNCLLMSERLHSISNDRMRWRCCLIVRLLHPTVIQSDARWRLSEFFVDWGLMRRLVHKPDREKDEKKNEVRFQTIQVNVVRRWSTSWLWRLFFFSPIRFDFLKNPEVHVFVDWKSFWSRFHRSFWKIREIFFTAAIRIVLTIYRKIQERRRKCMIPILRVSAEEKTYRLIVRAAFQRWGRWMHWRFRLLPEMLLAKLSDANKMFVESLRF